MATGEIETLTDLLAQCVTLHPKSIALVWAGKQWTFEEFGREVAHFAGGLKQEGVQPGDRVALLLHNCPEFLFAVFACAGIGAVFVPLNPSYSEEEASYALRDSGARLALTQAATQQLAPAGLDAGEVRGPAVALARPEPASLASITYTSGTTSRPKGVMLRHLTYALGPRLRAQALRWSHHDRVLCLLPLFHVNALSHMCLAIWTVGGSVALQEKFSASRFWAEVSAAGATTSSIMRTIPQMLLARPPSPAENKTSLRTVVALLPPAQHRQFEQRFNLRAIPSYSLTEDLLSIIGPFDMPASKLGSCGRPLPHPSHRLRILRPDGSECTVGESGEIVKQSPCVMIGYWNNAPGTSPSSACLTAATEAALAGGWLHTGDQGRLDADGYLWFVDRLKDMVRRSDENISSEEVERVLNTHPAVADAVRGEEVKAFVVLREGGAANAAELWRHCAAQLAAFKVPRYLEFLEHLPKTASQKVQKNLLRARGAGAQYDRTLEPRL